MFRENTSKNLLLKFYGFDGDSKKDDKLSTSKGIENFENITDLEETSEHLTSTEESGKNQNDIDCFDRIHEEADDTTLSKSPHVLTIEDFFDESKEDLQEPNSELDLSSDVNDKLVQKNVVRLEDTFSKAITKINESPTRNDINAIENSSNLSSVSVSKVKKLWRQKTILSKENISCSTNLLSKFNGVFLDLNYMGITDFPTDLLHHLKNLQMLYLDSNNLKEIPEDLFLILNKLKWLDLRNNQLEIIPSTVKGHESLETLLLQGNNLEKLPLELGLVPNLKNLQTAHNPLVFPPQNILELDCISIINFLREEWNKLREDERIELNKVSNDRVDKKPSTIICYQPLEKSLQRKYNHHNSNRSKSSVRVRSWNYKPSSRYGSRSDSWALKKIETNRHVREGSIILCNFCAGTLYRQGVSLVKNTKDESAENSDKKTLNSKKIQQQNIYHIDSPVFDDSDSNFLNLTGPSPRSLFIRKNLDFLVNNKQKRNRLCKLKSVNVSILESKAEPMLYSEKLVGTNSINKIFDVISNDRIRMKIKPLQLNESHIIINFLKAILKTKNQESIHVKKIVTCRK